MTSDMCQCAGCFNSRQAVIQQNQILKAIKEVNDLKAKASHDKHHIYDKMVNLLLKRIQ